jgi:hypothetical protein
MAAARSRGRQEVGLAGAGLDQRIAGIALTNPYLVAAV